MSFAITSFDQLLSLLDGGGFHAEAMGANAELQDALRQHQLDHGGKPKGELKLVLKYQLQKSGDVAITGEVTTTKPKAPPAAGVAYIGEGGQLTLESPFLTKMRGGVRDVSGADSADIRDPSAASGK